MENKETPELENQETVQAEAEEKIDVVKGIETLESQLIDTEKKLSDAGKELDETKNLLQRTLAEYDNYRKRTAKEKAETYGNGKTDAVMAILPVIDTMEMALSAPCSDENYKKGIELTYNTAVEALKKLGVEAIEAIGEVFDPKVHNAVMQEEAEGVEAGMVTKQFQKGYKMGDKVIRPSTVVVSC